MASPFKPPQSKRLRISGQPGGTSRMSDEEWRSREDYKDALQREKEQRDQDRQMMFQTIKDVEEKYAKKTEELFKQLDEQYKQEREEQIKAEERIRALDKEKRDVLQKELENATKALADAEKQVFDLQMKEKETTAVTKITNRLELEKARLQRKEIQQEKDEQFAREHDQAMVEALDKIMPDLGKKYLEGKIDADRQMEVSLDVLQDELKKMKLAYVAVPRPLPGWEGLPDMLQRWGAMVLQKPEYGAALQQYTRSLGAVAGYLSRFRGGESAGRLSNQDITRVTGTAANIITDTFMTGAKMWEGMADSVDVAIGKIQKTKDILQGWEKEVDQSKRSLLLSEADDIANLEPAKFKSMFGTSPVTMRDSLLTPAESLYVKLDKFRSAKKLRDPALSREIESQVEQGTYINQRDIMGKISPEYVVDPDLINETYSEVIKGGLAKNPKLGEWHSTAERLASDIRNKKMTYDQIPSKFFGIEPKAPSPSPFPSAKPKQQSFNPFANFSQSDEIKRGLGVQ